MANEARQSSGVSYRHNGAIYGYSGGCVANPSYTGVQPSFAPTPAQTDPSLTYKYSRGSNTGFAPQVADSRAQPDATTNFARNDHLSSHKTARNYDGGSSVSRASDHRAPPGYSAHTNSPPINSGYVHNGSTHASSSRPAIPTSCHRAQPGPTFPSAGNYSTHGYDDTFKTQAGFVGDRLNVTPAIAGYHSSSTGKHDYDKAYENGDSTHLPAASFQKLAIGYRRSKDKKGRRC